MSDSPVVDWEQLDMIADGYEPDFVEIYREFEADLPRIVHEAKQALEAGDAIRVSRAAHQAKGSAANFGFAGFSAVMSRIEEKAKKEDISEAAGDLASAEDVFRTSIALVKSERGI
jgi:HPt (histidine-containing phosphotransfer) domain-containing protein